MKRYEPWKIRMETNVMEVWFRWISFSKGWFSGEPCWFSGEYQIPPLKLTLQFAPENRPKPKKEAGSFLPTINFQVGNSWFQGGVFDDDTCNMGVSKNNGTPKSSILIGFSHYFHHPFWGTSIFGTTHILPYILVGNWSLIMFSSSPWSLYYWKIYDALDSVGRMTCINRQLQWSFYQFALICKYWIQKSLK